jgi:outer membrane protein TolC
MSSQLKPLTFSLIFISSIQLFLSASTFAAPPNTDPNQTHLLLSWETLVQQHPNLLVEKNLAQQQQWKVLELTSEQGFDIGISTNANVPIVENFESDFTRVAADDPYLDLVVSATHTLYDFGQSESLIDVERQRFIKSKINYFQAFEDQSHNLFTLVFDRQKTLRVIKESNYSIQQLSEIEDQMSRRFEAGIGTIGEIRRSQLRTLNIESKLLMLANKMEELDITLSNEYNVEPAQLTEILEALDRAYLVEISLDPNLLRSTEMNLHEQKALRFQLKNITSQSFPKFDSELNATLYDITRSARNYQLKGQIRIKLPVYDSGYRDAKTASIRHALLSEKDTYNQLLQKKTRDYQTNLRKKRDLTSRLEEAEERQSNLAMQLKAARLALGVTGSDLSGLSVIYQDISDTEISIINITFDQQQLHLNQLLLTEQLLTALNVTPELIL